MMNKKVVSIVGRLVKRTCPPIIYSILHYTYFYRRIWHYTQPDLFTEKLYWLKYYYKHNCQEKIQACYDKYTVRAYISEKIPKAEQYLPKLFGYYSSVEEINFDSLPNRFVLKVTQSCGHNLFCLNKESFDFDEAKKKLGSWLEESNKYHYGDESYFFNGKSGIICEEFIADGRVRNIDDIRFFCFNGEPRYVSYDIDSNYDTGDKKKNYYRNTYDMDWSLTDINLGRDSNPDVIIRKPKNFDKMVEIARALSSEFPFVRVDQYNIDGEIYIGELTFTPMGGNIALTPQKYEKVLGDYLVLPDWRFKP